MSARRIRPRGSKGDEDVRKPTHVKDNRLKPSRSVSALCSAQGEPGQEKGVLALGQLVAVYVMEHAFD
jgi:hypothetical protein